MIFTAQQIEDAIRELEQHKDSLIKLRQLNQQVEALEMQIVPGVNDMKQNIIKIRDAVCAQFALSTLEMMSKRRPEHITMPRQVVFYLSSKILQAGPSLIGRLFGKDHGTVIHGCQVIADRITIDEGLRKTVEKLESEITEQLYAKKD